MEFQKFVQAWQGALGEEGGGSRDAGKIFYPLYEHSICLLVDWLEPLNIYHNILQGL